MNAHQFWWAWPLRFQRKLVYGPWSSKNLINRNRLKKFMQVGVNVTCMYISFGGRGLSGFGDMVTFQKRPNFPFGAWTKSMVIEKFNRSESAQKIHASRD